MGWLLTLAENIDDPVAIMPLVSALPLADHDPSRTCRPLTERLAAHLPRTKGGEGGRSGCIRLNAAAWLNNLAVRLCALGSREQALRAAEEAVGHYRALAEARPEAFTPDLASSLNTLANGLSDLGRREDALAAAEEAVRPPPRPGRGPARHLYAGPCQSLNSLANG